MRFFKKIVLFKGTITYTMVFSSICYCLLQQIHVDLIFEITLKNATVTVKYLRLDLSGELFKNKI